MIKGYCESDCQSSHQNHCVAKHENKNAPVFLQPYAIIGDELGPCERNSPQVEVAAPIVTKTQNPPEPEVTPNQQYVCKCPFGKCTHVPRQIKQYDMCVPFSLQMRKLGELWKPL